jgi:hypothetical protein
MKIKANFCFNETVANFPISLCDGTEETECVVYAGQTLCFISRQVKDPSETTRVCTYTSEDLENHTRIYSLADVIPKTEIENTTCDPFEEMFYYIIYGFRILESELTLKKVKFTLLPLTLADPTFKSMKRTFSYTMDKSNVHGSTAKKRQLTVFATFSQPDLSVVFSANGEYSIWVSKPGHTTVFYCNSSCINEVPPEFYMDEVPIEVYVYQFEVLYLVIGFEVQALTYCPYPRTPFSSWTATWNCMSAFGRFAIVCFWIGFTIFFLLFLIAVAIILRLFYVSCCRPWITSKTKINVTNNMTNNDDGVDLDELSEEEPQKKKKVKGSGFAASKWLRYLTLMTIISLAQSLPIQQCGNITSPVVMTKDCQYTFTMATTSLICNGIDSCTVTFNQQITIGFPGQTACINFYDSISNEIFNTLYITYNRAQYLTLMDYQYFTSFWTPFAGSDKSCASTSPCPLSGCPSPVTNPVQFDNRFANAFPLYPYAENEDAYRFCEASCGCAGCGCFFCSSGCMWGYQNILKGNSTINGRPPLPVFTPGQTFIFPSVSGYFKRPLQDCYDSLINVQFINEPVAAPPSILTNVPVFGYNSPYTMNIIIISQVLYELPSWGDTCFFAPAQEEWYFPGNGVKAGPCADINAPIAGSPGDVQFNPSLPLRHLWVPQSVQRSFQQSSVIFTYPPVGFNIMETYPIIGDGVTFYAGHKWSLGWFSMYAETAGQGPLTLGLTTNAPFNISYSTSVVCPICSFVNLTGCSTCPLGIQIRIRSHSTCSGGVVMIESTGNFLLTEHSLEITTVDSDYFLSAFATVDDVMGNIKFTDNAFTCNFDVSGYAPRMEEVEYGNYTLVGSNETSNINALDLSDWWNGLSGIWATLKWVFAVLGGIAFIAACGAVVGGIIYLVIKCRNPYQLV